MIEIKHKDQCCGCTACYSICPMHCIEMLADEEGFLYPVIDSSKCIDCRACEQVCPIINKKVHANPLKAFAVQNREPNILYNSASGGAYYALAEDSVMNGGIVYGAAYDDKCVVRHLSASCIDEISIFSSSKYVQSTQGDTFSEIKNRLKNGTQVCYSGTPCQVAGLKAFLGTPYDNLFTVDLVCKGVSSPLVFEKYISFMETKYNSKIVGLNFKRKTYGYHSSTMSLDFENGCSYSAGGITDLMMRSFRANICLRPSCSKCAFKGEGRISDLTLFDCWHYQELTGKTDDDKGHTAVLVHTKKGFEVLMRCADKLDVDEIDAEKVIALDGIMVNNSAEIHSERDAFMKCVETRGLNYAVKTFIPIGVMDFLKESSKGILYKLHLLNLVKKYGR